MKSILLFFLCVICQVMRCAPEKDMHCVTAVNAIPRMFTRKKRFIVFPNYASMKITVAMGKSVIVKYPRGVNLSIEVSVYYPLPTILEEWYPKKYRSSTTPKPMKKKPNKGAMPMAPKVTIDTPYIMDSYPIHSESGTIWFEGNAWNSSIPFAQNAPPPKIKSRIWSNDEKYHQKYSQSNSWHYKSKPTKWTNPQWQKQPIDWSWRQNQPYWRKDENGYSSPKTFYDKSKWEHNIPSTEDYHTWKAYRGHRERRHIYDHFAEFETIFGVDMKSCILKAICESKKYLLPRGYSLIQDILRIIFSFPTIDGMFDEFSMAASESDCNANKHIKNCPFSIVDMALNPDTVQNI